MNKYQRGIFVEIIMLIIVLGVGFYAVAGENAVLIDPSTGRQRMYMRTDGNVYMDVETGEVEYVNRNEKTVTGGQGDINDSYNSNDPDWYMPQPPGNTGIREDWPGFRRK